MNFRNTVLQNDELILNVLRKIENSKSQKSLAHELSLSVGKVNYVLKALIEKGLVKAENFFANKHKNQYKYLLTEEGIKAKIDLTKKFIARKKSEYEELQRELENEL
ncbi:MarR family EPS-associated transcriptional regulator [Sulfurimonas sediminis]|uniref:MarR family EPS-associated transcriptional regulator n=1 Tax=Sulfurimonas sediminis TaxID=2590020 RepID=UPI001D039D89|nr:MarR family EPS-associated transcriptional regulator [Sulfurimonas sediminis]